LAASACADELRIAWIKGHLLSGKSTSANVPLVV
jgi:hypothetical protein